MVKQTISKKFSTYEETVHQCLDAAGAARLLANGKPVMLKPNLVNASPFPVTTSPAFCEAVITFIRQHTDAPIVIAEGCGDTHLETPEVFDQLGYQSIAQWVGVKLLDLNTAPLVQRANANCSVFTKMWLPEAVFEHILVSLPVLKAHSLCRFTGSMKNMMGLAPPAHYAGRFGSWKKAAFHDQLDDAIADLNRYRSPDLTVMDATVGLADFHLGGAQCDPPVNKILASFDAKNLDREAAGLLGLNWQDIPHLS